MSIDNIFKKSNFIKKEVRKMIIDVIGVFNISMLIGLAYFGYRRWSVETKEYFSWKK